MGVRSPVVLPNGCSLWRAFCDMIAARQLAARQILAPGVFIPLPSERATGTLDYRQRFPALDGIRALAVTLVFAAHYGGGGTNGGPILKVLDSIRKRGGVGVDIFFVLSGFLITGILYDTVQDRKYFQRFFARRSLRILPIVYLLFFLIAILTPIFHYEWKWKHAFFLVYLGNFFGNADFSLYEFRSLNHPTADIQIGHLWSLCVEEQFYICWPIIVYFVRDRIKLLWTSAILCVLTLLCRVAMVHLATPEMAELWIVRTLPFRFDALLFGAILALLLRGPSAQVIQRSMKWTLLLGLIPLLLIYKFSPEYASAWNLTIGLTLVGVAAAGLIGMTLDPDSIAFKVFHWRPARILGKYSYGFYVWHVIWAKAWIEVLVFFTKRSHSTAIGGLITLPLAFCVTFLMAKLSYDLFEVRFLKYKRHFEYDSEIVSHKHAFAADGR